ILTQVRDEGCKELKFDSYDLREYVNFDPKKPERWNNTMISVSKKLSQLVYFHTENNIFKAMPLFQEFTVDLETQSVTVEVSRKMEYILNKLNIDTGNWTQFEFFEFATLKSVYSKTVYRFLKQYRKTGFWKVSLEDFKSLLSIPSSYQASNIDNRVLKPVINELPSIFKGLKVHKIKSRRRGNQLLGYEFTFQKESTQNWIDDKFDNAGSSKTAPPGSKTPDWYDPDYKNETTPEQLEEMQKIKENALKQ
ncbi:MAG: replication initiation protein, partial [Clostridia bacterium]|nr:replication initiation protein [Clostridia bacterium]MBR2787269.1 replication initiation protein [Clostridia bacterium]